MSQGIYILITVALLVLGLIGTVLPVLPGSVLAWLGLLIYQLSGYSSLEWWIIWVSLIFVIIGIIIEYVLPIVGTKKMGGTKWGIWGSAIGLVVGLFFPPWGIILGPFVGAFAGELLYNQKDTKRAFRSALGSFVGFLLTTGYEIILVLIFIGIFIWQIF